VQVRVAETAGLFQKSVCNKPIMRAVHFATNFFTDIANLADCYGSLDKTAPRTTESERIVFSLGEH
jgi:hypothetical protein